MRKVCVDPMRPHTNGNGGGNGGGYHALGNRAARAGYPDCIDESRRPPCRRPPGVAP